MTMSWSGRDTTCAIPGGVTYEKPGLQASFLVVDDHGPAALEDLVELPFDLVVVLSHLESLFNQDDMAAERAFRVFACHQVLQKDTLERRMLVPRQLCRIDLFSGMTILPSANNSATLLLHMITPVIQ